MQAYLASKDNNLVDGSFRFVIYELADNEVANPAGADNSKVLVPRPRHVYMY